MFDLVVGTTGAILALLLYEALLAGNGREDVQPPSIGFVKG